LEKAKERYEERHKRELGLDQLESDTSGEEDQEARASKRCRLTIHGPKDDLELEGADSAQPPIPSTEFAIEDRYVGDMLMAFTFVVSYRFGYLSS